MPLFSPEARSFQRASAPPRLINLENLNRSMATALAMSPALARMNFGKLAMTSARNCSLGTLPYSSYPRLPAASTLSSEADEAETHRARNDPVLGWRDISSARSLSSRRERRRRADPCVARGFPEGARARPIVSVDEPRTDHRRASSPEEVDEDDEVEAMHSPRVPSVTACSVMEPALRCGANSDGLMARRPLAALAT